MPTPISNHFIMYLQAFLENHFISKISETNVIKLANTAFTLNAKLLLQYCICYLDHASKNSIEIADMRHLKPSIAAEVGITGDKLFISTVELTR